MVSSVPDLSSSARDSGSITVIAIHACILLIMRWRWRMGDLRTGWWVVYRLLGVRRVREMGVIARCPRHGDKTGYRMLDERVKANKLVPVW